jgi:uncharacterized protein YndB with AHSA1/START domain
VTQQDIIGALRAEGGDITLLLEHDYGTDVDDLWSAVTEPARLARWFSRVEGDLSPGGEFLIVFDEVDESQQTAGRVLECQSPTRLVVEWRFGDADVSTVSAELTATENGSRLTLEHRRLPTGQAAGYGAGWQAYLEALAFDLEGGEGHGQQWDDRWAEVLPAYRALLHDLTTTGSPG